MSRATKNSIIAAALIAIPIAIVFLFSLDEVDSKYENISAARNDRLFERGWLPDVLPSKTTEIYCSNNLDLNTSEGSFKIHLSEYSQFKKKLEKYGTEIQSNKIAVQHAESMKKESLDVLFYKNEENTWVFGCVPESGNCKYVLL